MKKIIFTAITAFFLSACATSQSKLQEYQTHHKQTDKQQPIVIRISKQTVLDQDVKVLLRTLELQSSSAAYYKDGETLQVGLITNRFRQLEDGRLILEEPDMKSFPTQYIPSMSYTLKSLRANLDILKSFRNSLEPDFPRLDQAIAVHQDYQNLSEVILHRDQPEGDITGWWLLAPGDTEPSHYQLTSIYQLALDRPELIKFLALPVTTRVFSSTSAPTKVWVNGQVQPIFRDSFLYQLNQAKSR